MAFMKSQAQQMLQLQRRRIRKKQEERRFQLYTMNFIYKQTKKIDNLGVIITDLPKI